jgi:spermidine synthase
LAAFAISGCAAMLYEVAWTRTLTMILGTTTFSFTTMVATFLLGIALGSIVFARLRKFFSPVTLLVWLQYVIAFSVLLTIPLFEILPMLYLSLGGIAGQSWLSLQLVRFVLAGLVMLVPTLALGVTFPAVAAVLVEKTEILGRRLGAAYGLNTLGAVTGVLLGGLLLVPLLGLQNTIVLGAVLNLAAGSLIAIFVAGNPVSSRTITVCCASLGLLILVASLSPWSPRVINSGVYVYADRYRSIIDRVESASDLNLPISDMSTWQIWQAAMNQYDLLYYKAGMTATVAVMERHDGVRFLSIDGKTDASTGNAHDMKTQVMIGQLPMLFHPAPDKVFVVGLGSGVTVGSVLTHDVRVVDCAELSDAVIEASEFFSHVNHRPLEDDRLRPIRRDARNVLLTSSERYDAIISQPSNPWITGQSSLFSLEWYQLVRDHLRHEGMLVQWLPTYHMSCRDVKVIMHTMRSVFPETTVWTSGAEGDLILIAKKGAKLQIDYPCLVQRASRPAVREDLARLGCEPADLLPTTFVMNADELGAFLYSDLKEPLPMNTDDLLVTEFSTPKHMVENTVADRFVDIKRLRGDVSSLLAIVTNLKHEPHLDKVTN